MNNEDIKVLEDLIYVLKDETHKLHTHIEYIQAIENLIKRNKNLEEEHQKRIMLALNKELVIVNSKMYTIDKELYNDLLNDTVNNYIPKSKVREILQELKDEKWSAEKEGHTYLINGNKVVVDLEYIIDRLLQEGDDK